MMLPSGWCIQAAGISPATPSAFATTHSIASRCWIRVASMSMESSPGGQRMTRAEIATKTLKRSLRRSAPRKACRRVRAAVPQCPPLRHLHLARGKRAGAPVRGTGMALHGVKSFRDREVKPPRDGVQIRLRSGSSLKPKDKSVISLSAAPSYF